MNESGCMTSVGGRGRVQDSQTAALVLQREHVRAGWAMLRIAALTIAAALGGCSNPVENAREEGYERGYEDGLEAGKEQGKSEALDCVSSEEGSAEDAAATCA